MGDLAGDYGGLARARPGEHQRGVLVGGDGLRLLGRRGRGEHALGRSGHFGSGGGDEASVGFLPGRLKLLDARGRLDASQRLGRLRGQEGSRQGAASALHGAGDVRLEPAALRLARIAATHVETVQAVAELCEFRRERSGDASGVREDRGGELLGLVAGKPADGALGAAGLAHGQSRPEPGAARLDAVDSADRRALRVAKAQHPAVERDTVRASAEQPNEGCAGGAYRGGIWCLHRAGCGISRSSHDCIFWVLADSPRRAQWEESPICGDRVSFAITFTGPSWDQFQVSRRTLRFLSASSLCSFLSGAGLAVQEQFGDWDWRALTGTSPEIITVARRA